MNVLRNPLVDRMVGYKPVLDRWGRLWGPERDIIKYESHVLSIYTKQGQVNDSDIKTSEKKYIVFGGKQMNTLN